MQIAVNLPNDFVAFQSVAEIEKDIRISYSLWLFNNARVTLAKAAELANLDIYDFMSVCKQNDVAVIEISKEELLEELGGMRIGRLGSLDRA
jgi:predicted HTH domain antitoxin